MAQQNHKEIVGELAYQGPLIGMTRPNSVTGKEAPPEEVSNGKSLGKSPRAQGGGD